MALHSAHSIKEIKIFYSYAQEDELLWQQLDKHLTTLRQRKLTRWRDHKILPGTERDTEIKKELQAAHIILLLISSDFIASPQCYDVEMQLALQRHEAGTARVIPIILRPVNWQNTPFKQLSPLPEEAKPVIIWEYPDAAFLDIANGIERVIDDIAKQASLNGSNNADPAKMSIGAAFANHAQQLEALSSAVAPSIPPVKLDFRRKLITEYDLDTVMQAFKEPLYYGGAFRFVVTGDERVLRQYVIERMLHEFQSEIRGECFTTPIDLNQQDLSSYPLPSLLEEKIKRRFNYTHARDLVMKRPHEHVILTVWNYDLPLLTVQEAIATFWQRFFTPAISRFLCHKNLSFVLILAHLPPENQPFSMDGVTSLVLPDFDVQRGISPWLRRRLHSLDVPEPARDYCLNQLQDLYSPVQILRRMEYIASYLQGEYNEGRFTDVKVHPKVRSRRRSL